MIRGLSFACAMLLASTAATAQDTPAPAAPAAVEQAPTPQPAPEQAVAAKHDFVALARVSLDRARNQCRYAFNQTVESDAQVGIGSGNVAGVLRFDPRLPVGERWTVITLSNRAKSIQRNLARADKLGPMTDVLALLPEGDLTMTDLVVVQEAPEAIIFSFKPSPVLERVPDENVRNMMVQMEGKLETRRDGSIVRRTLSVPAAGIRVGIAKLQSGSTSRGYIAQSDGGVLADSEVYTARATALITGAEVTTTSRMTDIEAICDPTVVGEIAARETAAKASARR